MPHSQHPRSRAAKQRAGHMSNLRARLGIGYRGTLGNVLIVAGLGLIGIGVGWLTTTSQQRLEGVAWLAGYGTDFWVGLGWVLAGLVAVIGGVSSHRQGLETAGTVAAIMWPLTVAGLFLVAQFFGTATTAWITSVSYSVIAYLVLVVAADKNRTPAVPLAARHVLRRDRGVS